MSIGEYFEQLHAAYPNVTKAIDAYELLDPTEFFLMQIQKGTSVDKCIIAFRDAATDGGEGLIDQKILDQIRIQCDHPEFKTYFCGKLGMM